MTFCSGPVKISRKTWLARENNPTVLAICKSAGGVPASQITWYSDDEVIQNQVQSISDLNQSTLKLNLTREQDGAFITCRAYHQMYEDNFSEEELELRNESKLKFSTLLRDMFNFTIYAIKCYHMAHISLEFHT